MGAWESVSLIWGRSPVWRVEIVCLIIGIVVSVAFIAWAATFVVMAIRTRRRTVREYPENVSEEIARLDSAVRERDIELTSLRADNERCRVVIKTVRAAVMVLPQIETMEE